jgi:predicted DNA-binding transcriptional regulator YafY
MSKITNTILMIKLLSNGRVYSVKELSEELGVTERMVRYYKEQLEMAGYIIESFKGPGGGYYINKNDMININYFNKYDLEVLDKVQSEISTSDNDKLIKDFIELNKKLHSIYNTNKVLSEYKDINVVVNGADDKINTINDCIKNKKSIFIDYLGSSGKIVKREIIPINIFEFENNIYVTAFCKLRGAIRHFNLKKIMSLDEIIK